MTANIAAAYIQDQVAFTDQVKLLAGLRYDRFKVDFDDRRRALGCLMSHSEADIPRLARDLLKRWPNQRLKLFTKHVSRFIAFCTAPTTACCSSWGRARSTM